MGQSYRFLVCIKMAPVESPIPKFSLDSEIPLDSQTLLNLKSPRKFEDKDTIISSVIMGVVGSSVEKAEKRSRNRRSRKARKLSGTVTGKRVEEKNIINAELKSRKEAEEKDRKKIETIPKEEALPVKKSYQWKLLTHGENGFHFFNPESKSLIEASEKWNEKIEKEFNDKNKGLFDITDEDIEVEDILTEFGEDFMDKSESEPMFTPHPTPINGNLLIGQMKFEHAADNKFKPFDHQSMYSKGRFGEVGNNPIDWFKKATPYQVTKNGKSDVLTPENLEENGKPSTTFKSFDTIDLHEFRKESEAFDYEKVETNDDTVYIHDNHKVFNTNEAFKGNHTTFKSFGSIDLMSEIRNDFGGHKIYNSYEFCDQIKICNDENNFSYFYFSKNENIVPVL